MKKVKNSITTLLIFFLCALFTLNSSIFATPYYNPNAALEYASRHWNRAAESSSGDKELCAGFVSHCLINGNIKFDINTQLMPRLTTSYCSHFSSSNYIYRSCWGLFGDLINRVGYIEAKKLTKEIGSNRVRFDQNIGKISKGDIIFFREINHDPTDQYTHVIIVSNDAGVLSDPYVKYYAHNNDREKIILSCSDELICMHFTDDAKR